MKLFTSVVASTAAMTLAVSAQDKSTGKVESILMLGGNKAEEVYISGATATHLTIALKSSPNRANELERRKVNSIFMKDPSAFTFILDQYEDRKYGEAQKNFAKFREVYAGLLSLPDNHATRAGFYELECMRKQLNLAGLVAGLEKFDSSQLTRQSMLQQMEVYKFWELAQKKDWQRLNSLAVEWETKRLPVSLRAQVEYCNGLALEALGRPLEALDAFARALAADFTKSEEINRSAVPAALRVYASLPEVKAAKEQWGMSSEDKNSKGRTLLLEANSLARLYEKMGLGAGVSLPTEHSSFLDFTPTAKSK